MINLWKKKFVILVEPHGQTSNNLFQHIYLDSYCKRNNAIFINPKFKFKSLYQSPINHLDFLNFWIVRTLLIKFKIATFHKFKGSSRSEFNITFLTYVKGWKFRIEMLPAEVLFYQNQFNALLQTEDEFEQKNQCVYVGLHIRRGDYKDFANGDYYLEDGQYIGALKKFLERLNSDFKVFIFTNDSELNINCYLNLPFKVELSNGSILQDYYRLSNCDYIIGPPSTFTMWANFISRGKVKELFAISKKNYLNYF